MPLIYVESDEVHDNFGDLSQPVINSSSTTNNEWQPCSFIKAMTVESNPEAVQTITQRPGFK